jgi:hypothetical protein
MFSRFDYLDLPEPRLPKQGTDWRPFIWAAGTILVLVAIAIAVVIIIGL